jgi:hypothetical protein
MAPAWLEKFIVRGEPPIPDARRGTDEPILKLQYTDMGDHRRILTVDGGKTTVYEIKRQAFMGTFGSKCLVTSPANGDKEVALIDYHTFSYKIDMLARDHRIDISTSKRKYESSGGLGELHWKGTGMRPYGSASWELRDETSLLLAAEIDQCQANGSITLWRDGLDAETVEELVMVGISQIEEYKRMLRQAKKSAAGVALNAALN